MCPVECELCKRLCATTDHLHGLDADAIHLCGLVILTLLHGPLTTFHSQVHSCAALCSADGICEIETAPQSIEATFTGRYETFQYTKVCLRHVTFFNVFAAISNSATSIPKVRQS